MEESVQSAVDEVWTRLDLEIWCDADLGYRLVVSDSAAGTV